MFQDLPKAIRLLERLVIAVERIADAEETRAHDVVLRRVAKERNGRRVGVTSE